MSQNKKIEVLDSPTALAQHAADIITTQIAEILTKQEKASLVLSGGSTPKALYEMLAYEIYAEKIDWNRILIFFGDERCVPPDHADSNFRMAHETLLSHVPIPEQNIFRIRGEIDPAEAAREYEKEIRGALGDEPSFDIVLLGIGPDGHTASLFPDSPALAEHNKLVTQNFVEKFNSYRITLTFPALNAAHQIFFLVSGPDKAETIELIFDDYAVPARLPSQLISPLNGNVTWLLDTAAASKLRESERG